MRSGGRRPLQQETGADLPTMVLWVLRTATESLGIVVLGQSM